MSKKLHSLKKLLSPALFPIYALVAISYIGIVSVYCRDSTINLTLVADGNVITEQSFSLDYVNENKLYIVNNVNIRSTENKHKEWLQAFVMAHDKKTVITDIEEKTASSKSKGVFINHYSISISVPKPGSCRSASNERYKIEICRVLKQ